MSKPESRRIKKRAELQARLTDDDLLSPELAPQTLVRASGEEALSAETDESSFASLTSSKEETFLEGEAVVSEAKDPKSTREKKQKGGTELPAEQPTDMASAATEGIPAPEQTASSPVPTAGALLKAAREAMGLSIDDASSLLKLAPRQIQAIEQQDFDVLPPRTFVRGFIRNYARLLNIDADAVLAALPPETPQAVSPAASSIKMSTRTMLPLSPYGKASSSVGKWLLAIAVIAVIAAALFFWPQFALLLSERPIVQTLAQTSEQAVHDTAMPTIEETKTQLPQQENENAHTLVPIILPLPETSAEPAGLPAQATVAPAVISDSDSHTPTSLPAQPAVASAAESLKQTMATAPGNNEGTELVLRFAGDSWTEVRDRDGKILYSTLAKNGSEKTLLGTPPFSLVIGNSDVVTVTWRGKTVDLSSHSKQGVARLALE
ncbi:MAG: DUF4115 domain-containing protein [Proteobacteria bacterium]|nr:DUF4115 domain-containing protein [Pseudomonadota bacterium]